MLTQIQDTLKAVDNNVFYGGVKGLSKAQLWNYIVFARGPLKRSARGNTSYTQTIVVVVVREEYVPEETIAQVIEAMEALPNVRFVDDGGSFEYDRKPNTEAIIEMAELSFTWVWKKVPA